jgi:uncharacterized membrane protein YraQ (UPF0718 family)
MTYVLWGATLVALIASFAADKKKTIAALQMAAKRLWKITPLFFYVIGLTAVVLAIIPPGWVESILGKESGFYGILLSLGLGSVTMMPGFVAFPLAAALKAQGVTYMVLAAFTMTLMNVGVVTFPLEKSYLGLRATLIRNGIGLILAAAVTAAVGLVFGEIIL